MRILLFCFLISVTNAVPLKLAERLDAVVYVDFESDDAEQRGRGGLLQLKDNDPRHEVAVVPGAVGLARDFSGTKDALLVRSSHVQSLGDVLHHEGLSLSFWLRHDSPRNTRVLGSGYGRQIEVMVGAAGGLKVLIGGKAIDLPKESALEKARWHYIVATVDFRAEGGDFVLYRDGQEVARRAVSFVEPFSVYRSDHCLTLGARPNGGNSHHFQGALDEVALFDRALTAAEVNALWKDDGSSHNVAVPLIDLGADRVLGFEETGIEVVAEIRGVEIEDARIEWLSADSKGATKISHADDNRARVDFSPDETSDYDSHRLRCIVRVGDVRRHRDLQVSFSKSRAPESRKFPDLPPVGAHPRLLFTPRELPELRANFTRSPHAQRAAHYIRGSLRKKREAGGVYAELLRGERLEKVDREEAESLFSLLANAAAVAVMEDDGELIAELAKVASELAIVYGKTYEPDYDSYLVHDASEYAAVTYDLLHDALSESGRDALREILAKMSRHRVGYGSFKKPWEVNGNWDTFHDMPVLCALAIEGEPGYDPMVAEEGLRKLRHYLTGTGIHRRGFGHEGDGYVNFGMERGSLAMLALAYRSENLFASTRFYQNTLAKFHEIQPWRGGQMMSHHDGQVWGTGFHRGNIFWVTQHVFPTDPVADYVAQTFAETFSEDRKKHFAAVLFSRPPLEASASPKAVAEAAGLPLAVFERERGLVNARSDWSEEAIRLDFECRMDLYKTGHLHADRNMFTLAALGRQWITDQGYHETSNDMHATVLIDGVGQPGSVANRWKSMPGKFISYEDSRSAMVACGDARLAYTYHNGSASHTPEKDASNPAIPASMKAQLDEPAEERFTWADFVFADTPESEIPEWKYRSGPAARHYNPVEKAFRSVMLVRGAHPYVVVVDDIRRDAGEALYTWSAPVSNETALNPGQVIVESANKTSAVLRFEDDTAEGSPRLWVKVLQAEGEAVGEVAIERRAIGVYSIEKGKAPTNYDLLSINRRTAEPKFKVLLYPCREGEELPTIELLEDRARMTLPDGTIDELGFRVEAESGRTVLSHRRE